MPPTGLYDRARFRVSGERCLLAEYGSGVDLATNDKVRRMAASILQHQRPGIEGVVPSYSTLAVLYDPIHIDFSILTEWLWALEAGLDRARLPPPRIVEIPVSYGGAFGPDIAFVAAHNRGNLPHLCGGVRAGVLLPGRPRPPPPHPAPGNPPHAGAGRFSGHRRGPDRRLPPGQSRRLAADRPDPPAALRPGASGAGPVPGRRQDPLSRHLGS